MLHFTVKRGKSHINLRHYHLYYLIRLAFCLTFLLDLPLLLNQVRYTAATDVVGIDLGNEFIKVALVRSGKPIEILLNELAKRKTLAIVSFASAARQIGEGAGSLSIKHPSQTFEFTNALLAFNASNGIPREYFGHGGRLSINGLPAEFYPYEFEDYSSRGSIRIKAREGLYVSPEIITANLFSFVRRMALNVDGFSSQSHSISDNENREELTSSTSLSSVESRLSAVATVSCSINQRQRQALVDAADLGLVDLVALVHAPVATAVHYSLDLMRTFHNSSYIFAIYDIGSISTELGIVRISFAHPTSGLESMKKQNSTHVQLLSCSSVDGIGGHFIDIELARLAAGKFQSQYFSATNDGGIFDVPKAMKKLLDRSLKAKLVLSANKRADISVEGLIGDRDFSDSVRRDDIESILIKLNVTEKLELLLKETLSQANLTKNDLDAVEVVGAGWRVPKIQEILSKIFSPLPLGQHINGDEAMAMGAGLIAANFSSSFRLRPISITDTSTFSYKIRIIGIVPNDNTTSSVHLEGTGNYAPISTNQVYDGGKGWKKGGLFKEKQVELLGHGKPLSGTKTVILKARQDLLLELFENDNLLCKYIIYGITESCKDKLLASEMAKVSIVFKINNIGIITLDKAFATLDLHIIDKQTESFGNTNNSNVLKSENTNSTEIMSAFNETTSKNFTQNSYGVTSIESSNKTNEMIKENQQLQVLIHLNVTEELMKPLPMNPEEKKTAKSLMEQLDETDRTVLATSEARNRLEEQIYSGREEMQKTNSIEVMTDDERISILKLLQDQENWLYEEGHNATLQVLNTGIDLLKSKVHPVIRRASEYAHRNETILELQNTISLSRAAIDEFRKRDWISASIVDEAAQEINVVETWLNESIGKQNNLPNTVDPILTILELKEKVTHLHKTILKINKIPKPKPKIEKKNMTDEKFESDMVENANRTTDGITNSKNKHDFVSNNYNGNPKNTTTETEENMNQTETKDMYTSMDVENITENAQVHNERDEL